MAEGAFDAAIGASGLAAGSDGAAAKAAKMTEVTKAAETAEPAGAAEVAEPAFDAVAYINEPRWQASRLGLERIRDLLERMGRPQDRLRFVHVAGTNGKGSTCAYLESILRCAGYRTGLFTSPYIERFEERIRVCGENISEQELREATLFVREHATAIEAQTGDHPTEFELMTAVALEHFARSGVDVVVLEVGLGGRLDSTNAIDAPEVCVITRIGLDHTALLGSTVAEVAAEKAGIVKAGALVVTWPQEPSAFEAVELAAKAQGCAVRMPDFGQLEVLSCSLGEGAAAAGRLPMRSFAYRGERFETRLLARYQPSNAALAIEAVEALRERGWDIARAAVREGIARAEWPGRFEVVAASPLTIIDGGHNPQGAEALAESLADVLGGRKVSFVMGVLADKDYRAMIGAIAPYAQAYYLYEPSNPRALAVSRLAVSIMDECLASDVSGVAEAQVIACDSPAEALAQARAEAGERGVVVAFGSLYSIADLKAAL